MKYSVQIKVTSTYSVEIQAESAPEAMDVAEQLYGEDIGNLTSDMQDDEELEYKVVQAQCVKCGIFHDFLYDIDDNHNGLCKSCHQSSSQDKIAVTCSICEASSTSNTGNGFLWGGDGYVLCPQCVVKLKLFSAENKNAMEQQNVSSLDIAQKRHEKRNNMYYEQLTCSCGGSPFVVQVADKYGVACYECGNTASLCSTREAAVERWNSMGKMVYGLIESCQPGGLECAGCLYPCN